MAHGCAEQCGRFLERAHPGYDLYIYVDTLLGAHLHHQGRHAIDARVARRDDAHLQTAGGSLESRLGTLALLSHARPDNLGSRLEQRLDKRQIILVSGHGIGTADGIGRSRRHLLSPARPDTHNGDAHILCFFMIIDHKVKKKMRFFA